MAMYPSLQLPWSAEPSPEETAYRQAGLVRTQGTVFLLPPDRQALVESFNAPPRPKTRMSAGAVALCSKCLSLFHFDKNVLVDLGTCFTVKYFCRSLTAELTELS